VVCPNELMLLLDDHAVICLASGLVDWLVGCLLACFGGFSSNPIEVCSSETKSPLSGRLVPDVSKEHILIFGGCMSSLSFHIRSESVKLFFWE